MENIYTDIFNTENVQSPYAKELLLKLREYNTWSWDFESIKEHFSLSLPAWGKIALSFLVLSVFLKLSAVAIQRKCIHDAVQHILHCSFSTVFILAFFPTLTQTATYMQDVLGFLGILLPTLGTVTAYGGNIATATASGVMHTFFLSAAQILLQSILPTIFSFFCGMAILDAFFGEDRFLKLSVTLKNLLFTAFAILLALFFILLRTQHIASNNTDAASARTLRLLVGNAIPIVGGTIGEALRYASAGLLQVKNTVGASAVFFLLVMYLSVFLQLFLQGALLSFFQFLSDFFGVGTQKGVYLHMKFAIDFLLAVYAAICIIGIVNIGIFMQTVPVLTQ